MICLHWAVLKELQKLKLIPKVIYVMLPVCFLDLSLNWLCWLILAISWLAQKPPLPVQTCLSFKLASETLPSALALKKFSAQSYPNSPSIQVAANEVHTISLGREQVETSLQGRWTFVYLTSGKASTNYGAAIFDCFSCIFNCHCMLLFDFTL